MNATLKIVTALLTAITGLALAIFGLAAASTDTPHHDSAITQSRPHSPSSGVYTLYDNLTLGEEALAPFAWVDISGSADFEWELGGDFIDDGNTSQSFPIDFIFPYYDEFYTEFRVSEKGYIFFESEGVDVGGGPLPGEIPQNDFGAGDGANNFIAPFAGDLFGYPGISRVYVRNDSSPRRTIIQFSNVVWCCGQNNPRSFQVILEPDGSIHFQYLKLIDFPGSLDNNQLIRIGLENLDGSTGDVYNQGLFDPDDSILWQDGLAIRYTRDISTATPIFVPGMEEIWDDPGIPFDVVGSLYLAGPETITRSFNLTHSLEFSSTTPSVAWLAGISHSTFISPISGTYTGTVPIELTVPGGAAFTDIATVTFTAESVEVPIVSDTFTVVYGPAHRDLQILKTLNPTIPPAEGGAFRYRLGITNTDYQNSGRAAIARSVVVTDLLPIGVVYEDCRRPPDYQRCGDSVVSSTIGSQTLVTWTVGMMDIDETDRIFLELRNTLPTGMVITNTANITLTDGIELGYPNQNSDSAVFTVASTDESNLNIYKEYPYPFNGQNFAAAGQVIPFDVFYYNDGREGRIGNVPITATVVDIIPEGTTFDRATTNRLYDGPQITPAISGPMSRTLTFSDVVADNGDWNQTRIRVWVNVPQSTTIGTLLTNTAQIDDGISNDSHQAVVEIASNTVNPFVDKQPSVDAFGETILPEPGKDYAYWITYGNRSVLTDATNFLMTDTLPASVTLISASPGEYITGPFVSEIDGSTVVTWSGDVLPAGATGQVLILVSIDEDVPKGTLLTNRIEITFTGTFTPASSESLIDELTLELASDINDSSKQVNNVEPNAGELVEYTITVSNSGDSSTPFTVTDVLPVGLTYDSHDTPAQGTVDVMGSTLSWTGGTVAAQSQESLTFRATVDGDALVGTMLRNTANIEGSGANINRSVDVTVSGGALASSLKMASPTDVTGGSAVTYTITVNNSSSASSSSVIVEDIIPLSTTLVITSFDPGSETVISTTEALTWVVGSLDPMSSKSLSFRLVMDQVQTNTVIQNVAYLKDLSDTVIVTMIATVTVRPEVETDGALYLPIVVKP